MRGKTTRRAERTKPATKARIGSVIAPTQWRSAFNGDVAQNNSPGAKGRVRAVRLVKVPAEHPPSHRGRACALQTSWGGRSRGEATIAQADRCGGGASLVAEGPGGATIAATNSAAGRQSLPCDESGPAVSTGRVAHRHDQRQPREEHQQHETDGEYPLHGTTSADHGGQRRRFTNRARAKQVSLGRTGASRLDAKLAPPRRRAGMPSRRVLRARARVASSRHPMPLRSSEATCDTAYGCPPHGKLGCRVCAFTISGTPPARWQQGRAPQRRNSWHGSAARALGPDGLPTRHGRPRSSHRRPPWRDGS